jgi:hypothetical protein
MHIAGNVPTKYSMNNKVLTNIPNRPALVFLADRQVEAATFAGALTNYQPIVNYPDR